MFDAKKIRQLLDEFYFLYDKGDITVENREGWKIEGELAEDAKMAKFIEHLAFELYLEKNGRRNSNDFRRQDKYIEEAIKILDIQTTPKKATDGNVIILSALLGKRGYTEFEVPDDTPLLKMFAKEEKDYYMAYLNSYFKKENKQLFNLDFNVTPSPNPKLVKVSIGKYLAPLQMTKEEKNIKELTMKARDMLDNYCVVEYEGQKRLLNRKTGIYEDEKMQDYIWATDVYKEAEELREKITKIGITQDSTDMYIDAVLQSRLQKQKAQEAEKTEATPDSKPQVPNEEPLKDNNPTPIAEPDNEKKDVEAPSEKNSDNSAAQTNSNETKEFMSLEEIKNYVNNYQVINDKVFTKDGTTVLDQDIIDKVKTAIMFYCEARDLKKVYVNNFQVKDKKASFYFDIIMQKYAANGEVNSYGINKIVNNLLNSNGHFEDQYVPYFHDKYAILKSPKKNYFESYLRLKFKEKGLNLKSFDVIFENVANSYIKVYVDMKLVSLKAKENETSLIPNEPQKDLEASKPKHFNDIANPFGSEPSAQTSTKPKTEQPKEGEQNQESKPAEKDEPKQQDNKNTRKVEKVRNCTAKEKIKNTLFIIGLLLFGEDVTDRSTSYCLIAQQIGYLRYESHKGNLEVTTEHIQNLRDKMAKSSDLTDKEKKRLEKRINKLAKKAKSTPKKNEPTSSPEPNSNEPQVAENVPKPAEPKNSETEPKPEDSPKPPTDPTSSTTPQEPQLNNGTPVRTLNEIIASLVSKDSLAVTDEEWKSMDDLQRQSVVKIKIHEARIMGDEKAINYWQDVYNKMQSEETLDNNEAKGR